MVNKIKNILLPFVIALQFLTRLPVSRLVKLLAGSNDAVYTERNLSRTLKYYPLIGLIIGTILVLTVLIFNSFASQHPLYIALIVSFVWLLITGGLHLDGVADMADAWVGGLGDQDKTLSIMKDPTCGPFGVISIVLVLLIKFVLVFELVRMNPYLLLFAPFIARLNVVVLLMTTVCARQEGMAEMLSSVREKSKNIISIFLSLSVLIYLLNLFVIFELIMGILLSCILFYLLFRKNILKRVSGVSGDLAGAFIEYTELMVLFSLVTLLITVG